MLPSFFTAFNDYFERKRNVVMSVIQTVTVVAVMCWPAISNFCMENYGFRGTVAIFAALSLNCLPAALTLQPVERHMKQLKLTVERDENTKHGAEILHGEGLEEKAVGKARPSIVSTAASVGSKLHDEEDESSLTKWERFSKAADLELFTDLSYLNMTFGLSLSFISDVYFIALFPLILKNLNFVHSKITTIMTIFFGADLISRIVLTVISGVVSIRNKYLFLGGTLLSATFRVGKD